MRRLKAIYLVPVFIVLLIGGAAAAYYFLFKPQMLKVAAARSGWEAARKACSDAEGGYRKSLEEQSTYAKKIFTDYHLFHQIQNAMPPILNVKEVYAGKEREGLVYWYNVMGTGKLINDLDRWAKGFHLPASPTFTYTGTLGYEDTLPSVQVVQVDFGQQKYLVKGYGNLLNAIRRTTGYGYFPLIIDSSATDKSFTVRVLNRGTPKHDPKNPLLTMDYVASGYFFTRGWDPGGADIKAKLAEYRELALKVPSEDPHRTAFPEECPKVLFYLEQKGLQP